MPMLAAASPDPDYGFIRDLLTPCLAALPPGTLIRI
jgi:hypothetical protein